MRLTKHHGLGNDFLVALEETNGPLEGGPELARQLCDRHRGIGADGFLLGAHPDDEQRENGIDVVMNLWNADGSRAEMSGNGIRCLAQAFAIARRERKATYQVLTDGGLRIVHVDDDPETGLGMVTVGMGVVQAGPAVSDAVQQRIGDRRFATIDVGNPHLIIEADLNQIDLDVDGPWFESQFADGINIEFIARKADDAVDLIVWERGAGRTQACGTGATAAAVVSQSWSLVNGELITVAMPGGSAQVRIGDEPQLIGPTQFVASIETAND